ncbi:two-component response regulator ARR2-like isoform X1 [Apium graveolens]|uniref:two-component response regulator ARR2-like isoform X1 n=1 Tax=Apium graveolens TaxID=4045 RepID=UPI003D7C1136
MQSSSLSGKSAGDGVSDQFPVGLRVLVVDDDSTCLVILQRMLMLCRYEVTKCDRADIALSLLRENKSGFDIVLSDVHMPDMDGFKLLEHIGLEMDLPVIMMSADDSKNVVMKGVTHGACDYLIKPVRIEALKNIWQHVVRKKKHEYKGIEQSGSVEDGNRQQKAPEDADYSSSANEGSWKNKRRKDEEDEAEDKDDTSSLKKARVVWSVDLHQQFVTAVNQLGIEKAVPKKILEMMNVDGLTRENVASHLQKYRIYLRRVIGQQQSGLSNSFMGTHDASFGSMSPFNGLGALAATGQIPAQSLATLQAAAGRSTTKSTISPLVEQRNVFNFQSPDLHFIGGQQLSNSSKQMNFLHGIPTSMEPKQLAAFGGMMQGNQSNSLMVPMTQQARAPLQDDTNFNFASRLPLSSGNPILSNGITNGFLGRNGLIDNVQGPAYNQVSQPSAMVDFSASRGAELLGNDFVVGGISGISPISSKEVLQEEASMEMEGSGTYDIFNDLHQHKSPNWDSRNIGLNYDPSQNQHVNMRGNLDTSPSFLVQQNFLGDRNMPIVGQQPNQPNVHHPESSFQVKAESFPETSYENTILTGHYDQDDLMSAVLKQQQQGSGGVQTGFKFNGYYSDHLPT